MALVECTQNSRHSERPRDPVRQRRAGLARLTGRIFGDADHSGGGLHHQVEGLAVPLGPVAP